MRTVILAVIVSTGAALLTSKDDDAIWKVVGEPEIDGDIPLKMVAKQDMKCSHGADKCGDPFIAFYNTVTETCIDKYDAGAECGMFDGGVQNKVCKFNFICHDWKDEKHPNKKTCMRPQTEEQCQECMCGRCVEKTGTFSTYKECDMSCSMVSTKKAAASEHCAKATVEATVRVRVTAEHPDGRRGTATGVGRASGQGTSCVPCGDNAARDAQAQAIQKAQKDAVDNAIKEASKNGREAAVAAGKNSMKLEEAEKAAKAADGAADAAEAEYQKAKQTLEERAREAQAKAIAAAKAAGKGDAEQKRLGQEAYDRVMGKLKDMKKKAQTLRDRASAADKVAVKSAGAADRVKKADPGALAAEARKAAHRKQKEKAAKAMKDLDAANAANQRTGKGVSGAANTAAADSDKHIPEAAKHQSKAGMDAQSPGISL